MRLIFATNNAHKTEEMRAILGDKYSKFLCSLNDFSLDVDPDENGSTFEENANIKSKATYEALRSKGLLKIGDIIFSDDTGICIDFFDGAPGIHSARFMGDISHKERNEKIIQEMKGLEGEKRAAHFITKLSVIEIKIDKDFIDMPKQVIFSARVDGYIANGLEGVEGFGYDPIFVVKECMKKPDDFLATYARLGQDIKNKVSHRAKAVSTFLNYLEKKTTV